MTGRDHPRGGIMIPIPQYPLYTATIAEFNAYGVSWCIVIFVCIMAVLVSGHIISGTIKTREKQFSGCFWNWQVLQGLGANHQQIPDPPSGQQWKRPNSGNK